MSFRDKWQAFGIDLPDCTPPSLRLTMPAALKLPTALHQHLRSMQLAFLEAEFRVSDKATLDTWLLAMAAIRDPAASAAKSVSSATASDPSLDDLQQEIESRVKLYQKSTSKPDVRGLLDQELFYRKQLRQNKDISRSVSQVILS